MALSISPVVEQDLLADSEEDSTSDDSLDEFDTAASSDIIAIIGGGDPAPGEQPSKDSQLRAAIIHRAGTELLQMYRNDVNKRKHGHAGAPDEIDDSAAPEMMLLRMSLDPHSNVEVLSSHFAHLSPAERLDKAIQLLKRAADCTTTENRWDKMRRLREFGLALGDKYYTTFSMDDIDTAIVAHRQILGLLRDEDDDIDEITSLVELGYALKARLKHRDGELPWEAEGSADDMNHADEMARLFMRAAQLSAKDNSAQRSLTNRAVHLTNRGYALHWKFRRISHLSNDLDAAIKAFDDAAAIDTAIPDPERLELPSGLADALSDKFQMTKSGEDLERLAATHLDSSIQAYDSTILLSHGEDIGREVPLSSLGFARFARYETLGLQEDLEKAIDALESASRTAANDNPLQHGILGTLCIAQRLRFRLTGSSDISSLYKAIETNKKLLELLGSSTGAEPNDSKVETRQTALNNLGACLQLQFESEGLPGALDEAISSQREAVDLSPTPSPSRSISLAGLAESYTRRYYILGRIEDISAAVELGREAVAIEGLEDTFFNDFPLMLTNLGLALVKRYEALGIIDDLEDSLEYCKQAEKASIDKPTVYPLCCNNLGYSAITKFFQSGTVACLNEGATLSKKAVELALHDQRILPLAQNNVCRASVEQIRLGLPSELSLDEMLAMTNKALASLPPGHTNRALILNCHAVVLFEIFEQTGSVERLEHMVQFLEDAVAESRLYNCIAQATQLRDLAEALATRFEWMGTEDDLDKSIDCAKESMEKIPETYPQHALHLITYARVLTKRASHTSSAHDFNSAIGLLGQAGNRFPEKHPKRAMCMNNLASALGMRSMLIGTSDDLNAAIQAAMAATSTFPGDFPGKAACLANLGQILMQRFLRASFDDDIDIAVDCQVRALKLTAKSHWRYVPILENLSSALLMRFQSRQKVERTKGDIGESKVDPIQDLNEAVERSRQTLKLSLGTSPDRARYLANASKALLALAKLNYSSDAKDLITAGSNLDEAIRYSKEAVDLSARDESQFRPDILLVYVSCLATRFKQGKDLSDRNAALEVCEEILMSPKFPVSGRVTAAISAANMLYHDGVEGADSLHTEDDRTASRMLSQAVELLPRLISRSLLRSDQQFLLAQVPGLAADAASLEIRVNKRADEAVRLLELGRGVIASLYMNERSAAADVENDDPVLAKRFKDIQQRLDRSEEDVLLPGVSSFLQSQAARRYDLVQEFDRVVTEIRSRPGLDRFLLGPTPDQLTSLAVEGPIVYLNVSRYGSTALIITEKNIQALALEQLRYDDVAAKAERLSDIRDNDDITTRRANNLALISILRWLWNDAVEIILKHLNFTALPESEQTWPRVWWIPVGPLTLFPIHAAGSQKEGLSALDRVISSYATTAKSLAISRERISALYGQISGEDETLRRPEACLVSMKTTPQRTDLPFAEMEVQSIAELLPNPKTVLAQPTREQVVEALQRCSIVHLACHGEIHPDPSRSRILFRDWEDHSFSVHDVASMNFAQRARLAYLSACHAGTSKDTFLLDEAIHMTGACQLAGFPAVVGTLWKLLDEYAPLVARDVYTALLDGNGSLDVRRTAHALHFAVRSVRSLSAKKARGKPNPIAWAPYIYLGV
ncbi:hypothetical protein DRE_02661 [Drechslerella stenobrocha 248]|uniref:CHAT domain-containing protein n=1 Tax=Drechslerella stenobrocha 248 TaxID=1043628 RepID=W7I7K2_9PEZI|nr:hypothetical protein DRE_02661 [Drechslerella stenobrocha 248]